MKRTLSHVLRWGQMWFPGGLVWAYRRRLPIIKRMYEVRYQSLSERAADDELHFMNWGYVPDALAENPLELSTTEEPWRDQIQLYRYVADKLDLRGTRALEVSCGRGGGTAYLAKSYDPSSLVGIDIAQSAIEHCRRVHSWPGLEFRRGDAEQLDFAANGFDRVLNIESLHCYPNPRRFFGEAFSVLRPGGRLAVAALYLSDAVGDVIGLLRDAGFVLVENLDITENVLVAARRRESSPEAPMSTSSTEEVRGQQRFGMRLLAEGTVSYRCWICRKPEERMPGSPPKNDRMGSDRR